MLTSIDLLRHLSDGRNSDIKDACLHNRGRLEEWAKGGYKGDQPKTQYASKNEKNEIIKNKEGKTIYTDTPSKKPDDWNEVRRRTDAPPAEDPLEYPSEEYMSRIVGLWETGTRELQKILETPEEIRGEPGKELLKVNAEIDDVKNEYVRGLSPSDKSKAGGIPQLAIPTGMIVEALVECTERAIRNGTSTDDPQVSNALNLIKQYVSRANQGEMWIENMEKAFNHHIQKAQQLYNAGADSIQKIHASNEFWNADLADWIRTEYMASARSTDAGPEWRHSEPDSDGMSISSEEHANARDPEILALNNAGSPTATGQDTADTAQSQPLEDFGSVSGSSLPTADNYTQKVDAATHGPSTSTTPLPPKTSGGSVLTQTVRYKRALRPVGGVRNVGLNRYQCLVQMNNENAVNPFWHIVAAGKLIFDPTEYLKEGGYLVKATESTTEEEKKNSVEGGVKDLKGYKLRDFRMRGIAVIHRESGEGYQNKTLHVVQGYLEKKGPATSKFYTISDLARGLGKQNEAIYEAVEGHMEANDFPLQAKPLARSTARPRRGKRFSRGESDDEGEDIEHEDDGPLDPNDGIYPNEGPSLFVEPHSTDSSSASKPNKGDQSRGGDYVKAAFVVPNSESRPSPSKSCNCSLRC